MKYLIILFILFGYSCGYQINTNRIYIHQTPDKTLIIRALNIIINSLDKCRVYTKAEMINVLNNYEFEEDTCQKKEYALIINFTNIECSKEYNQKCIPSDIREFENRCILGLFNGKQTITMINKPKIHQTSFAHEMLHYFELHIKGNISRDHTPREFWENMVGFGVIDKIGVLNEELKKAGL